MSVFEKPAVVIDNGSHCIKAGFACDNHPVSMFRTLVGRPSRLRGGYGRAEAYDVLIGDEAVSRSEDYELTSPIVNGRIVQWDNTERIWHHVFYRELKAAPEDRAVILACSPATSMAEKIKCCQVFFETLNVPALCIQPQSSLSLYGSGYVTGIAVDLGYDTTDVNPVYEGGLIGYAHMRTNLAGAHVCDYIQQSLLNRGIVIEPNAREVIDDIIKELYLTQDSAMPREGHERLFKLPSGETIDVGQEAFMAAEMLFQPELVLRKSSVLPLQEAIVSSVLRCDSELRSDLCSAIVTSGGLSMIPGVNERIQEEVSMALKKPVHVVGSSESHVVAWMGGATFAGISEAHKMWVTKKQYEDHGASVAKKKFM